MLQVLPWPALLLNDHGRVECVNGPIERCGVNAHAAPTLIDCLPEYARALQLGPPWKAQEALVTREGGGQQIHERLWLRPMPTGAVLIAVDETRLQNLEAEHAQTVRLASLGFLLAGVCHEISNPLAAVYSMVQLLTGQGTQDPHILRKGLESISANVHRILEISRKLSGFARADLDRKRPCAVDRAIEEAIGLVRHDRSYGSVAIEHEKDPEALVWCNVNEMQQVFFNVLANSVQAMEGHGRIVITTRRTEAQRVEVGIQDDGPGIRPEHLGRVFEPFFSTKLTGQGTGLGLAICNELVREHGGTMRAESTFGKGARFYIELPLWSRK